MYYVGASVRLFIEAFSESSHTPLASQTAMLGLTIGQVADNQCRFKRVARFWQPALRQIASQGHRLTAHQPSPPTD